MNLSQVNQPHIQLKWMRSGAIEKWEHTRRRRQKRWFAHIEKNDAESREFLATFDPATYRCDACGSAGIKLWRETGFGGVKQYCAPCSGYPAGVDTDGKSETEYGDKSDQLYPSKYGNLLPSVPCDGGWWGYTSVPDSGVKWWKSLPTYKEATQ